MSELLSLNLNSISLVEVLDDSDSVVQMSFSGGSVTQAASLTKDDVSKLFGFCRDILSRRKLFELPTNIHPVLAKLKKFMEDNNVSQRRVSVELGVSTQSLINWLNGSFIPRDNIIDRVKKLLRGGLNLDSIDYISILTYLIDEVGLTQYQIAEYVGKHPTVISYWVNGSRKPNNEDSDKLLELYQTGGRDASPSRTE